MFSQMSVCHSVQGVPYVTITHDALDLTVSPPLVPRLPHIRPGTPHPPSATDIWWPTLETFSNLFTPSSNIWWWPLKHV